MAIWQTTDEVRVAEAHERRAVSEAKAAVDIALKMLRGRGVGYEKAVSVLRTMSCDELRKLAAKSKKQPKIVHASNDEGSVIDDDKDDKPNPDEQLDKLAVAVQRAFPKAQFSKAQAIAWSIDNLPEARQLTMASKQQSLDRSYGEKCAGYFDKMAGLQASGRGTTTDVSHTPPPPKPKVVRDPRDREAFDAGNARISDGRKTPDQGAFSDRVKELQNTGLNFDQASTRALRERVNPDAISP